MSDETEIPYEGTERRHPTISPELFEKLANRTADIVEQRIKLAVGGSTIKAAAYIIGAGIVALAAWLGISGQVK